MKDLYVQYGCGLSAPPQWVNFDVSPTLRLQKILVFGKLISPRLNVVFPDNVKYGDIIKGLSIKENSCNGVFCSHTLEHLSLEDFRLALKNTFKILKPGGLFRCVVPDLEYAARQYINDLDKGEKNASHKFIGQEGQVLFGVEKRIKGIKGIMNFLFSNSHHMWMWDHLSLADELKIAGFINIRACKFNDSSERMFLHVEDEGRFINNVAFECSK